MRDLGNECGHAATGRSRPSANRADGAVAIALLRQPVRYPDCYAWFVFFSSLDIMLTSIVLALGGMEANPLVDWVLERWGLVGVTAYKFTLAAFVVCVCEFVGRHRDATGRRLAEWTVAITFIPVFLAIAQLWVSTHIQAG